MYAWRGSRGTLPSQSLIISTPNFRRAGRASLGSLLFLLREFALMAARPPRGGTGRGFVVSAGFDQEWKCVECGACKKKPGEPGKDVSPDRLRKATNRDNYSVVIATAVVHDTMNTT